MNKPKIVVGIPFSTTKYFYPGDDNKGKELQAFDPFLEKPQLFLSNPLYDLEFFFVVEHSLYKESLMLEDIVPEFRRFWNHEGISECEAALSKNFYPKVEKLQELGFKVSIYNLILDTGIIVSGSGTHERLKHITAARNLITDFCIDNQASHLLALDSDVKPKPTAPKGMAITDFISALLEPSYPLIGGFVDQYSFVLGIPGYDETVSKRKAYRESISFFNAEKKRNSALVLTTFNTAGFNLIGRDVFNNIRWRYDLDKGMTDDPCFGYDAACLGYPWIINTAVTAIHPCLTSDTNP